MKEQTRIRTKDALNMYLRIASSHCKLCGNKITMERLHTISRGKRTHGQENYCSYKCFGIVFPDIKLVKNLQRSLQKAMRGHKGYRSTWILLGYTREEFINHMSSKLKPGMSLETAQIDHIRPLSSFDKTVPKWWKEAFVLSNLQPLTAKENMSKGSKWDGYK